MLQKSGLRKSYDIFTYKFNDEFVEMDTDGVLLFMGEEI